MTLERLCRELEAWCSANGLAYESADEILAAPGLTSEQRVWLWAFIDRWDDQWLAELCEQCKEVDGE